MKGAAPVLILAILAADALAGQVKKDPLGTVLSLMDELTAKITAEGEAEAKAYSEFVEWCDDMAKNAGFQIKTFESKKGKLEAKISALSEEAETASSKIEDLAAAISANEKDLADATVVFEKETADFNGAEAELVESIDTLSRAISILEREMAKNPAAFAQLDTSNLNGLIKTIGNVVEAASFAIADKQKLMALMQSQQNADDFMMGAPKPANYKSHSNSIFDVLEDMKDKAEDQLQALRKDFVETKHNYDMMVQSLNAQIDADKKGLAEEKAAKAEAEEDKATAEEDLTSCVKNLADAKKGLAEGTSSCMAVAADHDASIKARAEELKVIAEAKKIIVEATSLAQTQVSLLQFSLRTRADLAGAEVVAMIKRLGKEQHSASLTQLASKIAAVMQYGASAGEDPFEKVKGLLKAMIAKLEKEAGEASEEKAYCDEQMSKTEAKKSDLEDDVDKLKVKLDSASSKSAGLKEDVKELQSALAALAKEQAEMDTSRSDEHATYVESSAELKKALLGVRKALGLLRDYYGSASAAMLQESASQPAVPSYHAPASGAGGSIISILEVVESDFAKELATVEKEESDSAAAHEQASQENAISKTTMEQDAKYKTQAYKGLDASIAEMKGDLKSTTNELDAVLAYYEQIKQRCIAKAETYSERVKRRTAEIKGLKEALTILENETALVQRRKHGLRGHALHSS